MEIRPDANAEAREFIKDDRSSTNIHFGKFLEAKFIIACCYSNTVKIFV